MIRLAEEKDIIGILKVIRRGISVVSIGCAHESFSSARTAVVIRNSIQGNLCVVSEIDEVIVGVCLGVLGINVFCDDTKEIQLLVNLIDDKHRGTSLGGRMFIEWTAIIKAVCKDDNKIKCVWLCEQPKGTNIDFERRGFKLAHTSWLLQIGDDDD